MTELDKFKQDYRPKEGYKFLLAVDPINGKLNASIFKLHTIKERNRTTGEEGEYVMEASILNVKDSYENFVKILTPYIDKSN